MGNYIGYVVIIGFGLFFIGLSSLVAKRFGTSDVDGFVAAGRSIPFGLVAASCMVSWIWTTTLIGAAETGLTFGVSGGFNYAWGAALPFFVFIPIVLSLRKRMPNCTTFLEFIKVRYGRGVADVFLAFALLLVLYILLAQGIGIGVALSYIFNMPYKVAAALPILIVGIYIWKAGLRGSIFNDLIQFFIISIVLLVTVPLVLKAVGMENIYNGMVDVVTNPENVNHNPEALSMLSASGFRYGIVALIVALGQVILDQGYYSKAVSAANTKTLLFAYIIGTVVAWAPVPILCGNVFGNAALALGASVGNELSVGTDAAPYIMKLVFGGGLGSIMYALMMFMAGMTTAGGGLAGAQAIFTIDVYDRFKNPDDAEEKKVAFGKKMTLLLTVVMALVVMLFEGKSLLQVDIFSGIIFAAPCSAFIAGLFWKKTSPKVAVASIFIGMAGGIIAYFAIPNGDINYVIGNIVSLVLPALIVFVGSLFSKYSFDFDMMKNYVPTHKVADHES